MNKMRKLHQENGGFVLCGKQSTWTIVHHMGK